MAKLKLIDTFIKNHTAPEKRVEIYDTLVDGLAIRITTTGHKSFVYRYWFGDKKKRFTIGKYPTVKLAEARDIARDLYIQVSQGVDPLEEKKRKVDSVQEIPFKKLAKEFKDIHLPPLRESTQNEYTRIIDNELVPKFGNQSAKTISKAQILSLLDKKAIKGKSPTMANRIRARLHTIYEFGIHRGLLVKNPVSEIKPYSTGETKRSRYYKEDEIRSLWEAFNYQKEPARSIFKLLLLSGQRSRETRHLKWENIKGDVWTIPAELSKSKRKHEVPLSEFALMVLNERKKMAKDSEFIFESPTAPGQPFGDLKRAKNSVQKISGVKDFRPHDLRRTAATYMAKINIDRTVLGKILNHKGLAGDGQVTAIYDRYDYLDEKKNALNKWGRYLQTILESKDGKAKIHKISG